MISAVPGFTGRIRPPKPASIRLAITAWPTLPGVRDAPITATVWGSKREPRLLIPQCLREIDFAACPAGAPSPPLLYHRKAKAQPLFVENLETN